MCGAVQYIHHGEVIKVYFPNPKALLPVLKKDGDIELVPWGRRKEQEGRLPQGGWARLESIDQGVWKKWSPTPVKIIVDRFMEKDLDRISHWFDMKPGEWIQGLVAHRDDERRVYVVTVESEPDAIHHRWPRILGE